MHSPTPRLTAETPSAPSTPATNPRPYAFVFLEIFEREGGIQSYVQGLLNSYLSLPNQPQATVFLLRDRPHVFPSSASPLLQFRSCRTPWPALSRLRLMVTLWLYLLKQRPQRVFCGHINLAPLMAWLCKPLGIPYTVMTHGKEVWLPLPLWTRLALQQADQIWTVSRYTRDRAAAVHQLDPAKIRLLPCAIDGDRFTPGAPDPALLEQYDLVGSRVLLTVARLWSGDIYKGVDITIRALPKIAQAIPSVKYLVIGRGDDQARLAQLADALGVGDRVVFAGFVPTEALVQHYRLADAYIMPSQEGFGIVYLEAMACGLSVLSGHADGSADPLQDGRLGWQVPHRDPDAVAQACIEILQGIEDRQQGNSSDDRCKGEWLRQQTLASFDQAAFTQRLHNLLSDRTAKP